MGKKYIPGVTAVICTYRGANRLRKVVNHLAAQRQVEGVALEVLICDNNSDDSTLAVANDLAAASSLRIVVLSESRQGKRYALEKSLKHVRTTHTAIVDDDNFLPSDYLYLVWSRFEADADVGFIGTATKLVSDGPIPSWFLSQQQYFAVGMQAQQSGYLDELAKTSVWGAGMVFRTELWSQSYANFCSRLAGRNASNLVAGEDSEFCYLMLLQGYRGYLINEIVVGHYMPAERMTPDYLLRLRWSLGYGAVENEPLITEIGLRNRALKECYLILRHMRFFLILNYRIKIIFNAIGAFLTSGDSSLRLRAQQAAYQGSLDAIKTKTTIDFWSFPFGSRGVAGEQAEKDTK